MVKLENMDIHHLDDEEHLNPLFRVWFQRRSKSVLLRLAATLLVPLSVFAHAQTEKSERNQSKSLHALRNLITELKSSTLYRIS